MGALGALAVVLTIAYFLGLGENPAIASAAPATSDPTATEPPVIEVDPSITTSTTAATTSSTTSTTTTPATATTKAMPPAPPHEARYVVPGTETEPEAKQRAVDVAHMLTTYEATDDPIGQLYAIGYPTNITALADATEPLTYAGSWSRGEVLYPQMGGLTDDRASVMVVVRQTVGTGPEPDFSVVRTLDIRLERSETGWEFASLESAGGTFDSLDDLRLAHEVADDPRIEMPDSARLDIRAGLVSPTLLRLMATMADRTPYGVTVLATGHPTHVFETDRVSHHTLGRAIDIYRVGDELVVDDRNGNSQSRALVRWLFERSDVIQVGSPWELDETDSDDDRSFTDVVHQDHIHIAVGP
jgi:hypothetical protein